MPSCIMIARDFLTELLYFTVGRARTWVAGGLPANRFGERVPGTSGGAG